MKAEKKQAIKQIIEKVAKLQGVSFINIPNYLSKTTQEIADHLVNVGISIENAKQNDLNRLIGCTDTDIQTIANNGKFAIETVKIALSELIESATKNLNPDKTKRTNQSQAQNHAYLWLNKTVRIHLDTLQVHIFAQTIRKTVKVKGTYKTVNSSDKTLAKNAIKKHLDLRTDKFRDYIIENIDALTEASI